MGRHFETFMRPEASVFGVPWCAAVMSRSTTPRYGMAGADNSLSAFRYLRRGGQRQNESPFPVCKRHGSSRNTARSIHPARRRIAKRVRAGKSEKKRSAEQFQIGGTMQTQESLTD